jgi:hypothetical protein
MVAQAALMGWLLLWLRALADLPGAARAGGCWKSAAADALADACGMLSWLLLLEPAARLMPLAPAAAGTRLGMLQLAANAEGTGGAGAALAGPLMAAALPALRPGAPSFLAAACGA